MCLVCTRIYSGPRALVRRATGRRNWPRLCRLFAKPTNLIVSGEPTNIKITGPEDLALAQFMLQQQSLED